LDFECIYEDFYWIFILLTCGELDEFICDTVIIYLLICIVYLILGIYSIVEFIIWVKNILQNRNNPDPNQQQQPLQQVVQNGAQPEPNPRSEKMNAPVFGSKFSEKNIRP
jgi:hypothetical protein